jgi:hypothetical protein
MKPGDKWNWKSQPERLEYLGTMKYPGDSGTWYQFCKVDDPEKTVWCEVLASDLHMLEETK